MNRITAIEIYKNSIPVNFIRMFRFALRETKKYRKNSLDMALDYAYFSLEKKDELIEFLEGQFDDNTEPENAYGILIYIYFTNQFKISDEEALKFTQYYVSRGIDAKLTDFEIEGLKVLPGDGNLTVFGVSDELMSYLEPYVL